MADFKLPDPKGVSGKVLGVGLALLLGFLGYTLLLPWLLTVVWGTVQLAIGIVAVTILGYILTSGKFWKRTKIILDTLGEIAFGWFINMNPFTIMEMQLDRSEQDREQLKRQAEKLKAQEDKLKSSLQTENETMQMAIEKISICKQQLKKNPQDDETKYALESATTDFTNSKDFIDKVSPVAGDISRLVTFVDKAYRKSGYALKNARNTVAKQRATYEAVTAGNSAMKRALRAFTGDPEMNRAGAKALEALKSDIAQKVGAIRNSIQLTSQIMNEQDLEDAAKVNLAANQVEKLNIDSTFDYVQSVELPGKIPANIGNKPNKYLDELK